MHVHRARDGAERIEAPHPGDYFRARYRLARTAHQPRQKFVFEPGKFVSGTPRMANFPLVQIDHQIGPIHCRISIHTLSLRELGAEVTKNLTAK